MFHNVAVYAGDKFYNPSEATIRKFQYQTSKGRNQAVCQWDSIKVEQFMFPVPPK